MAARNIVTTDMKSIRDNRDVHETEEFNAYIEMQEKKKVEREAMNRRGDVGLENERSFNKKVETKKEQQVEKAKEKAKEHKKEQEKILLPPTPSPEEEVEEVFLVYCFHFHCSNLIHLQKPRVHIIPNLPTLLTIPI